MKMYGNSYWNNATDNAEKSVITLSEEEFFRVQQILNTSGMNYYAYAQDNTVRIAILDQDVAWFSRITGSKKFSCTKSQKAYTPPRMNAAGTVEYHSIPRPLKYYFNADKETILKMAVLAQEEGLRFSFRIYSKKKAAITVFQSDMERIEQLGERVKAERAASFNAPMSQIQKPVSSEVILDRTEHPEMPETWVSSLQQVIGEENSAAVMPELSDAFRQIYAAVGNKSEELLRSFLQAISPTDASEQGIPGEDKAQKTEVQDLSPLGTEPANEPSAVNSENAKHNSAFETEGKPDSLEFHFGEEKDSEWFTESDLLHDFVQENPDHSFALGNAILQYLDEKQHSERNIPELKAGWYKKTDFSITAVINGEGFHYDGRFDIGDGKGTGGGSLIDHIRAYNEGILGYTQHPFNQPEYKERAQRTLDVFVPFLEAHSELTAEEQRIFEDFKAKNPIRTYDDVEKAQGTFKIYQLPSGEKYHGIRFEGREQLEKDGVQLDHEDYELIYEGVVGEFRGNATLESIYTQFNANHPEDFRGHSLSVSDVVVIDINGEQTAYYCDKAGFVEMPEFFREKEIVQEKAVVSDEQEVSPLGTKDNGVSEEHEDPIGAADELRKIYHDGKTAFYCFTGEESQLNLNTLPLITEKSEQYLIAAGSCLLSDEFMQEHHITFLKYGRDLAYQEDADHMLQAMRDAALRVNERFTKLSEEEKQFIDAYPSAFISEPYVTPWGTVQGCHEIAKGVFEVSTAGHGGIMIREELAEHMLSPEALEIGFIEGGYHCYEEDADAQVPLRELFDKGIVDIQQYVSEKYVKSYEEIGDWLNTTINNTISACHPDYWTAHENAEKSKETPTSSRPTITCEWNESDVFEDGKTYSVAEFDSLMKEADKKRHDGWQKGLETYGSNEAWREQDEKGYFQYLGYSKTKFTVNMPDGTTITERQDIGDGYGGVIDFLRRFGYEQAADVLENDILTHPTELPVSDKTEPQEHFTITDDALGEGGQKAKFNANIAAIQTLKQLEKEHRPAITEEKETLSRYVGWGGLAPVFEENNPRWADEHKILTELLTAEEYRSARSSTLDAFYTTPVVIDVSANQSCG